MSEEENKKNELINEMRKALAVSVINHCYICKYFRVKGVECKDKENKKKCYSKNFRLLIDKANTFLNKQGEQNNE